MHRVVPGHAARNVADVLGGTPKARVAPGLVDPSKMTVLLAGVPAPGPQSQIATDVTAQIGQDQRCRHRGQNAWAVQPALAAEAAVAAAHGNVPRL